MARHDSPIRTGKFQIYTPTQSSHGYKWGTLVNVYIVEAKDPTRYADRFNQVRTIKCFADRVSPRYTGPKSAYGIAIRTAKAECTMLNLAH
jgi:hypothetical protein